MSSVHVFWDVNSVQGDVSVMTSFLPYLVSALMRRYRVTFVNRHVVSNKSKAMSPDMQLILQYLEARQSASTLETSQVNIACEKLNPVNDIIVIVSNDRSYALLQRRLSQLKYTVHMIYKPTGRVSRRCWIPRWNFTSIATGDVTEVIGKAHHDSTEEYQDLWCSVVEVVRAETDSIVTRRLECTAT
jgi:hypothetical protein